MGMIVVLVFLGVFSVVALVMFATGQGAAQNAKQVVATLESALATETPEVREQLVDLRKTTNYSRIPWLNDQLVHLQIAPLLQTMLKQADLKWSAGQLMSMCCVAFAIPAYAGLPQVSALVRGHRDWIGLWSLADVLRDVQAQQTLCGI